MKQNKKIVIASDHRGFKLKQYITTITTIPDVHAQEFLSISWVDVGAYTAERSDYPIFVDSAIARLQEEKLAGALLLCATGNGMAIAANRYTGIYACIAWNAQIAQQAKQDDNSNVLVIPAEYVRKREIIAIISHWLFSEFKGGRYAERLELIDSIKDPIKKDE